MTSRTSARRSTPGGAPVCKTRALFRDVMGLVAVTIGFTALGAYIGRDLGGGWGIAAFVVGIVLVS